jgi:hypothetical protein
MGRTGRGTLLVAVLVVAACSSKGSSGTGEGPGNGPGSGPGNGPAECPAGTVREGDRCVVSCPAGNTRCGDVCCGAGTVCGGPNQCVASLACGPGLPQCPDGQGCLSGGQCAARDLSCTWVPPVGEFNPRIAWRWTGSP